MEEEKSKDIKGSSKNKIIILILTIILIISIVYLIMYSLNLNKEKQDSKNILNDVVIDEKQLTEKETERMLQLKELQKENNEIIAWLEIDGTNINYPVCQAQDNSFYIDHNYKKEKASTGALFIDKDCDIDKPSTTYLIYGHRNKTGIMFEDLIKYSNEDFYKEHKEIKFTTAKEDSIYEIIAVFKSRVFYKSEKNVFRYYYFINAETKEEYDDYINNCKKASLYDTGVTAQYGEQLITLSTCEYSQEDGRFVVVAKKK